VSLGSIGNGKDKLLLHGEVSTTVFLVIQRLNGVRKEIFPFYFLKSRVFFA